MPQTSNITELRAAIDRSPMSNYQIFTVAICVVINMIDGFDVLAVAFAGPAIAEDWSVSSIALGSLLSSGLVGMLMGSLFLAPLADQVGRRRLIITSLTLVSVGMFASALTQSIWSLSIMRWLTGLGVGGALASVNTLTAEYSSSRRRDMSIAFLQTGFPIGATIGGAISTYLLLEFGWRSVFVFGGACSVAILPLVVWRLPESLDFLISSRGPNTLQRINTILVRMGWANLDETPAAVAPTPTVFTVNQILATEFRSATLLLWFAFSLVFFANYFLLSWTPKLLVDAGLSATQGVSGTILINVGGITGALIWGAMAPRNRIRTFLIWYFIAAAAAFIGFAFSTSLWIMLTAAFTIGFFIFPCVTALYTIAPRLYPTAFRTTGVGWAIGIGRVGAILGPYIAGILLAFGWEAKTLYIAFALPLLLAATTVARLNISSRYLG